MSIVDRILHIGEGKKVKQLQAMVPYINQHEDEYRALSNDELAAKTADFKHRLDNGESLDDMLPEAYATVREGAERILGQRHYDVQIMAGVALHYGWITEMKTGEGKTLASTLPAYLNALGGKGVHIVTVNDYLARRDAEWMGGVHRYLGIDVGLIQSTDDPRKRQPAYAADITYGTNNEFGFDYLRDNMTMKPENRGQRGHKYAIVDEVDSILIDEARTPLIISGRVGDAGELYRRFAAIAPRLVIDEDYEVDEGKKIVTVTEEGVTRVEKALGVANLYDEVHADYVHHLTISIKAKELFKREVQYIVRNGEVLIVDEFTGRILEGRRYNEGLHQAIEAKEGVRIKEENQTLATITLQNYFRLYDKLAGMTGTAMTEAAEFKHTYDVDCVPIPTHRDNQRDDHADLIYKTEDAKFNALIDDIEERHANGQPILIGTVSIDKNERLGRALSKRGIDFALLNAKNHEREAKTIAQAGRRGAVTVATNMAGRGVDIVLGGNPEAIAIEEMHDQGIGLDEDPDLFQKIRAEKDEVCAIEREQVLEAGGLFVIGTERHESRRIDNQLRGRSGRQGDPGASRFYLSLDDDLMRMFASDTIGSLMERLKMPDDMPIEAKMVTKAIERAQGQVEERNFEIRKNVVKYDEVLNLQRQVVYEIRQRVLDGEDMHDQAIETLERVVDGRIRELVGEAFSDEWDLHELIDAINELYPTGMAEGEFRAMIDDGATMEEVVEHFQTEARDKYEARTEELGGEENQREIERQVMLSVLDNKWREHLDEMDYLQEGINLRAFAQTDPLAAFKREGYDMFEEMLQVADVEFVRYMFRVKVIRDDAPRTRRVEASHESVPAQAESGQQQTSSGKAEKAVPVQARSDKVKPNVPCPCGSGNKTKVCHPEYCY